MRGSVEGKRMYGLFEDLYDGEPWLGVNMMSNLSKISASQAAARPLENCNTIWEITQHMILWRENVLERLHDKVLMSPEDNYIEKVLDTSSGAWKAVLQELKKSQQDWKAYLENVREEELNKVYGPNNQDYYKHIHGILQHDAYHLGQIILLLKFV